MTLDNCSCWTWWLHPPLTNDATYVQPFIVEEKESPFAYKRGMCWELNVWGEGENVSVCKRVERKRELQWQQLQRVAERAESWVWVKWSSFSMYCVVILSLSLNNIDSPVDVGDLPNHVKYCVSVLALHWAIISTSPVGFPNNWYQSRWFKWCLIFC